METVATLEWQASERGLRARLETAIDYNSLAWPITVLRASPVFTCTVCLLEPLVGLTEAKSSQSHPDGESGKMRLRTRREGAETVEPVLGRRDGDCLGGGPRSLRRKKEMGREERQT